MSTVIDGKPLETIFIGKNYWILADGKWQNSDTAGNNLDFDIAGLVRTAKAAPAPFDNLPEQTLDGKRLGAFEFTFKNGTEETCNYDLKTYLVTRCKTDDLTLLYSAYNDPSNHVANPK